MLLFHSRMPIRMIFHYFLHHLNFPNDDLFLTLKKLLLAFHVVATLSVEINLEMFRHGYSIISSNNLRIVVKSILRADHGPLAKAKHSIFNL